MRTAAELVAAQERNVAAYSGTPKPFASSSIDPGNQDYRPIAVKVKQDGGAAGSLTTQCTFTYEVWRGETPDAVIAAPTEQQRTTFRLATTRTPAKVRAPLGRYIAAANASWGEAVFDLAAGQWGLLVAWGEREAAGPCDQ